MEFLKQFPHAPLDRGGAARRLLPGSAQGIRRGDQDLDALVERDPRLSDQVLLWLGDAGRLGSQASVSQPLHQQMVTAAVNTLHRPPIEPKGSATRTPKRNSPRGNSS